MKLTFHLILTATDEVERDLQASQEAGGEKNGECGGCGGELGEIFSTVVASPNMEMFNRFSPVLRKPS